jgi:hypothetical protein
MACHLHGLGRGAESRLQRQGLKDGVMIQGRYLGLARLMASARPVLVLMTTVPAACQPTKRWNALSVPLSLCPPPPLHHTTSSLARHVASAQHRTNPPVPWLRAMVAPRTS